MPGKGSPANVGGSQVISRRRSQVQVPLPRASGVFPDRLRRSHCPVPAGMSKERIFESSLVVQIRQRTNRPETGALQSKPANTSTRQQRPRKTAKPARTSRASVPQHPTPAKVSKPRLAEEQKREHGRARTAPRRQRQLELGLCVSCSNEPIEGQTRCPECAERHRQHWQNSQPKRKTAQPNGPPKVTALTDD